MVFLANENFSLFSIKLLRNAGHNVASVIEETPGAKDLDISKRARRENRIVLTFDCCKELIARKKFDGNREAYRDFEMVENKEDPISSIEDIREPLEKMLKEKRFSCRIKNKIKEILEELLSFR